MSINASGTYELSDSYLAFMKERHIWNGLSAYDRQKALHRFWSAEIGGEKPYTGTSAERSYVERITKVQYQGSLQSCQFLTIQLS
jgi:hypothetical protein